MQFQHLIENTNTTVSCIDPTDLVNLDSNDQLSGDLDFLCAIENIKVTADCSVESAGVACSLACCECKEE